jgi:rhamnosyltransferase subunit B
MRKIGNMGKRIVLSTYGSLGDLYPYLAIALELKARGHQPVIATSEQYRDRIEAENIKFYPLRLDGNTWEQDAEFLQVLMDSRRGIEYIICYQLMAHLRATYTDLLAAVQGADMLITHPLILPGTLVAEQTKIPWVSSVLSANSFMSAYDIDHNTLPALSEYERGLQLVTKDSYQRHTRWRARYWSAPVRKLRSELGLPSGYDPVFEGQHSPNLVLALFSRIFAQPEPDWPSQTVVTGFPFYDGQPNQGLSDELRQFLDNGPPPIVFTLGSTAVLAPGNFYLEGAIAANQLGYRSVLLMGKGAHNVTPGLLPQGAIAVPYAPHAEIFPHAAAIVHHGGMGTTGQALRSGRPMLVVPYNYEQPENAARAVRLGVGRMMERPQYTTELVAAELKELLSEEKYAQTAAEIRNIIESENGVETACHAIEVYLNAVDRLRFVVAL